MNLSRGQRLVALCTAQRTELEIEEEDLSNTNFEKESVDDSIADPDFTTELESDLEAVHYVIDHLNMDESLPPVRDLNESLLLDQNANKSNEKVEEFPIEQADQENKQTEETQEVQKKVRKRLTSKDKVRRDRNKHPIKNPGCSMKCRRNCKLFTDEERYVLWDHYWSLDYGIRRKWMAKNVHVVSVNRRVAPKKDKPLRCESRKYFFPKDHKSVQVCRSFFLNSLGFTNDSVITELIAAVKRQPICKLVKENRGCHAKTTRDLNVVKEHIQSYKPCVSHYRRYNAPNVRYLPRELSVKTMVDDFNLKYPTQRCGRETYRKTLKQMNISLNMPKSDSCVECMAYKQARQDSENEGRELSETVTANWNCHKRKAEKATAKYKLQKELPEEESVRIYSMDLQKVLLLPMMPGVKDCFFTSRLVAFNESFATLKRNSKFKNYCAVWHEAIANRSAQSITDSILTVINCERDVPNFIFWADNCSAQNKNWVLYTALVVSVNQPDGPEVITINYLTKGHTHMSADSIHGNIERRLSKIGNVNDFEDLKNAMKTSRKKLEVVDVTEFREWVKKRRQPSRKANDTLQNFSLLEVVEVVFTKNSRNLKYKTDFDQNDYYTLDFLQTRFNATQKPDIIENVRGIRKEKKDTIISNLVHLMPPNRQAFWKSLPEATNSTDLALEHENEDA